MQKSWSDEQPRIPLDIHYFWHDFAQLALMDIYSARPRQCIPADVRPTSTK